MYPNMIKMNSTIFHIYVCMYVLYMGVPLFWVRGYNIRFIQYKNHCLCKVPIKHGNPKLAINPEKYVSSMSGLR